MSRCVPAFALVAGLGVACTRQAAPTAPAPDPAASAPPSTSSGTTEAPPAPSSSETSPSSAAACSADTDCVPARCCHSRECVVKTEAPDCLGKVCTMDCRGGTLDCGGTCGCEAGKCVAHVRRP